MFWFQYQNYENTNGLGRCLKYGILLIWSRTVAIDENRCVFEDLDCALCWLAILKSYLRVSYEDVLQIRNDQVLSCDLLDLHTTVYYSDWLVYETC